VRSGTSRTGGAALVLALCAAAAPQRDRRLVELRFAARQTVADLCADLANRFDLRVLYDPADPRFDASIGSAFHHSVPENRLFDTYAALLAFFEVELTHRGGDVYVAGGPRPCGTTRPARSVTLTWLKDARSPGGPGDGPARPGEEPRMRAAGALVAGILLLYGRAGAEQVEIKIAAEARVQDLLTMLSRATGHPVVFDPRSPRLQAALGVPLDLTFDEHALFDQLRAVLTFYEIVLVPLGPYEHVVWAVRDMRSTNKLLENKALYVDADRLEDHADKDGFYLCTTLRLRHLRDASSLVPALSTLASPAGAGTVRAIDGERAIVVSDFAPAVHTIARVVERLDRPATPNDGVDLVRLAHSRAAEVVGVLTALYDPARPGGPRFTAHPRLNAVAVSCEEGDLVRVQETIRVLDVAE
jgi:hypothetical protein